MASYYKRKNGTYCVRVSHGMKNGRQNLISTTYKPPVGITAAQEKKEVKRFADLFEAAVHSGVYVPGMKAQSTQTNSFGWTIQEFIRQHYFQRIEKRLSPNTVRFYRIPGMNQMLGLDGTTALPHLRTIRGAVKELRSDSPGLGLGEDQIRTAVQDGRIDCIRIGNRTYIALEFFKEPYVQRFTRMRFAENECKPKLRDSTHEQLAQLVVRSQGMPAVQRVRKQT